MKCRFIWLLASWLIIAALAGCNQVSTPLAAETVPDTTPASTLVVATPTTTTAPQPTHTSKPIPTNIGLNEETTPVSDEATPVDITKSGLQLTAVPVTVTQIIQEETMTVDTPIPASSDQTVQLQVKKAREDLSQRLSIDVDQIKTLEIREVIWPDSSLGCPEEGVAYQQVPQAGLLIRLGVGENMYFYHGDKTQAPFLCEQTSELFKRGTPKVDELVPPPDWEID